GGLLTDRFNRKLILGIGLLGNASAIALIGLTRRYDLLMLWATMAGLSGTLFHPAAGALVPSHYPKHPGVAIGLMGIGSGIPGFVWGPDTPAGALRRRRGFGDRWRNGRSRAWNWA